MNSKLIEKLKEAVMEKRVGNGPRIYLVDEKTVGKRCWSDIAGNNGFNIGKFLFERGVQVPEMYELVRVDGLEDFFDNNGMSNWFILMQRINGIAINNLTPKQKRIVLLQHRREIEKVLDFGIFPFDSYQGYKSCLPPNALFNVLEQRLYLIDFEFWRHGTREEIDECRNNLNRFYHKCVWK